MAKARIASINEQVVDSILEEIKLLAAKADAGEITHRSAITRSSNLIREAIKDGGLSSQSAMRLRVQGRIGTQRISEGLSPQAQSLRATGRLREQVAGRTTRVKERVENQRARMIRGAENTVRSQLSGVRVPNTFGFGSAPASGSEAVTSALEGLSGEGTAVGRSARTARRGVINKAVTAGRGAARSGRIRSMVGKGGVAGVLGAMLTSGLMNRDKQEIDPQVQMALAQRIAGGSPEDSGLNTSRTLRDMGKLLTIIRQIQEMTALQGQAVQPRLI